ncbi:hypothetical protein F5X99DRAFT_430346 [Biscogniauxia marginata]|nr:hypothetical protein F5X99DRAFT_430346 [Biscogniauxia marginata]
MVDAALRNGDTLENAYDLLFRLPTEMSDLFRYTLRRVDPNLRLKAYIMLETVLRTRTPLTLLELALIVHVAERRIAGKSDPWSDHRLRRYPSPEDFLNPVRLQTQLIASCKCILETFSGPSDDDYHSIFGTPSVFTLSDDDLNSEYHLDSSSVDRYNYAEGVQSSRSSADQGSRASPLESLARTTIDDNELVSEVYKPLFGSPIIITDTSEKELEEIERMQYRDFDHARTKVRLLHRSAKDFLLEPKCLDALFEDWQDATTLTSSIRAANGHAFILYFAMAWLDLSEVVKSQLRCHFDTTREIAYNAPQIEFTLGSTGAAPFFELLDDLDLCMTRDHRLREYWPIEWFENDFPDNDISTWGFTFPAFAVVMDMRGYVQHLINKAIRDGEKNHFLNEKDGRPLILFPVFFSGQDPKPAMTEFLLEQGADVNATFEHKTVIESLQIDDSSRTGSPHLETMKLLLNHGADPDSRYIPEPTQPEFFMPLLHIVAHLTHIDLNCRIDFMKYLKLKGANLNAVDYANRTLVEVLYWGDRDMVSPTWEWLFRQGAKITKSMISTRYHEPVITDLEENTGVSELEQRSPKLIDNGISPAAEEDVSHTEPTLSNYAAPPSQDTQTDQPYNLWADSEDFDIMFVPYDVMVVPFIRRDRHLRGLCDQGGQHEAYKILSQRKFRDRRNYTDEAIKAAETCYPSWFVE